MADLSIGEACISSVCVKEEGFMDYRFAAYRAAEDSGFKVIRNPEDTGITQTKFSSILKQHSPVFILIIGDEKSDSVTDECRIALERGLPVFAFLKVKHVDIKENEGKDKGNKKKSSKGKNSLLVDNKKYISDATERIMKEISWITYNCDCAVFSSCEELYMAVRYRLNGYIDQKLKQSPIIQYNKGSTYYYAYEQILAAKKRIILSQKTSLLILGPRRGNTYEERTYEAIVNWIKKMDNGMQFIHVFSWEKTLDDMKDWEDRDEYDLNSAKKNMENLLNMAQKKGNITFRVLGKEEESIAYLITDTGFQLVLPIAGEVFNLVLPYYFTSEDQLMKIITHINTRSFMNYDDILKIYSNIQKMGEK